ncbi:MAG: carboxynorspermidine decarboxylase [Verrucomicrobiales bacterium]
MASFVISLSALKGNSGILREIRQQAGCKIVLALKGFSCWKTFSYIRDDLDGCCASGIWEAKLSHEEFGKHTLTYSPAFQEGEIEELLDFTHHLDFNSLAQWKRYREQIMAHPRFLSGELHCGLRINPEHSTGSTPLYDPCVPGSRLGIPASNLENADLSGISGLHFHTLCEQGVDDLESTLDAVEERFGQWLSSPSIRYLNLGGGHWITKPFYQRERLIELIQRTKERYQVEVWLEPGEAAAIHTGVLRSEVIDIFESMGHLHAILDTSATAHMPDVLEMPYRPDVFLVDRNQDHPPELPAPAVHFEKERYHRAKAPDQPGHLYRLGGPTCLAGDVTGDYGFPRPLEIGDQLVFDDMAHYTMVKTTTFNGVPHPDIVLQHDDGHLETLRSFHYEDFKNRLA